MATYVFQDFACYEHLIKDDGYIFFHDCHWEGSNDGKGVASAIQEIARFIPVYQVVHLSPISHYYRRFSKETFWGGIAIIRGQDLNQLRNK